MMPGTSRDRPGLQAERTMLSWDRTTLGILGNGALLLLRHASSGRVDSFIVAGAALVVAIVCVVARSVRARTLRSFPTGQVPIGRREIRWLGISVTLLGVAMAALVAVESFPR